MAGFNSFVLYVMIWWTLLFAVLPVGTRTVAEADEVTGWRGLPSRPRLGLKLIATTVLATALWGLCRLVFDSGWVSFRSGWMALPTS